MLSGATERDFSAGQVYQAQAIPLFQIHDSTRFFYRFLFYICYMIRIETIRNSNNALFVPKYNTTCPSQWSKKMYKKRQESRWSYYLKHLWYRTFKVGTETKYAS